jgi:hypothetical protein
MARIPGFLKDPLAHFLIAGALLVYAGGLLAPAAPDKERIVVNRAALLEFIQYRSKAFEPQTAAALLDSMSPERRQQLIDDYVREEVLYREARLLSLEADDYVIKQRLIQKLSFATEAAIGEPELSDAEIAGFYEANKSDYAIPPSATFTHVYFSAEKRGAEAAESEAARQIESLNKSGAHFEDAVKFGDRFLFHTNYVERTFDYVASQFGEAAAEALFDPRGPFDVWRGPIVSPYGAHTVFVTRVLPGRAPPLEEVRERVSEDALRARKAERFDEVIDETIADYQVVIDLAPQAELSVGASGEPER